MNKWTLEGNKMNMSHKTLFYSNSVKMSRFMSVYKVLPSCHMTCQSSPLKTCILSLSLSSTHINTLTHKEEFIREPVVMKNIMTERKIQPEGEMETDNERDCGSLI